MCVWYMYQESQVGFGSGGPTGRETEQEPELGVSVGALMTKVQWAEAEVICAPGQSPFLCKGGR